MIRVHGSCVAIGGAAVLIRGPSGAGKSDLALRLIEGGAVLVADDQVELTRQGDRLYASPPPTIAGLLEVRGVGIFQFVHRAPVALVLLVDLVKSAEIERLPEPATDRLQDCSIEQLALFPWEVSAAAKVRLAVEAATGAIMRLP